MTGTGRSISGAVDTVQRTLYHFVCMELNSGSADRPHCPLGPGLCDAGLSAMWKACPPENCGATPYLPYCADCSPLVPPLSLSLSLMISHLVVGNSVSLHASCATTCGFAREWSSGNGSPEHHSLGLAGATKRLKQEQERLLELFTQRETLKKNLKNWLPVGVGGGWTDRFGTVPSFILPPTRKGREKGGKKLWHSQT